MIRLLKIATVALVLLCIDSVITRAQSFQPDPVRLASMMLVEKTIGDVDNMSYIAYLDSLGFKKSDADIALGKLRLGEIFYKKGFGRDTVQVEVHNMKINKRKVSRSVTIKTTSDSITCRMVSQLKDWGMEEVDKKSNFLGLAGNGIVAGLGEKILIMRCEFAPSQSYNERPITSNDGKGWMATVGNSIIGSIKTDDTIFSDTLITSETVVSPKRVFSFTGKGGSTIYLFIYSVGQSFFYDEATVYAVTKEGKVERRHFINKDEKEAKIGCKWWNQTMVDSDIFAHEYEGYPDEEKYGIHFLLSLRSLYVPVMDGGSDLDSPSSLRHTGRFAVYRFNGTDFVYDKSDGETGISKKNIR